jgi:Protein of unknown function (DUF2510)
LKATRSTLPYLIAAGGGALLFLSLFLSWLSGGGVSFNAWDSQVFSIVDFVLAALGLVTAAIAGSRAMGNELPVAWLRPQLIKWLGVVALSIVGAFVLENDDAGIGAFLGLIASGGILAGAILAERPDLAARVADATGVPADGPPLAAPPAGLGSSASAAAPSARATTPPAARSEAPTAAQPAAAAATSAAEPAQAVQSSGPPAGWYPDPQGQARLRYWDGATWTEQTSA